MNEIRIQRLPHNQDLPLPVRHSEQAAGYDVVSAEPEFKIQPGARRAVATGLALALPPGIECQVRPRSGLAFRHGLTVINAPGTIDPDYRGEVKILLWNAGAESVTITRGMRIAQLVFARFESPRLTEVPELDATLRGAGGFGSTGS